LHSSPLSNLSHIATKRYTEDWTNLNIKPHFPLRPWVTHWRILCLIVIVTTSTTGSAGVLAEETTSAAELARAMYERDEGNYLQQQLTMTLIAKNGRTRSRVAQYQRAIDTDSRRTLIRFTEPQRIRGSSFLTHEHGSLERADDQWLYLPALRRVRRVAASDRGDFFFGSDFTYEDVKNATKFDLADYNFKLLPVSQHPDLGEPEQPFADLPISVLEAVPVNAEIANDLGYGRVVAWVDTDRAIPLRVHYWNPEQKFLKRILITELDNLDGIWTPIKIEAFDALKDHRSIFEFDNVERPKHISNQQFSHTKLASAR